MKILIVDDEALARKRVRSMLKHEQAIEDILEAAAGDEAVASIINEKPDIVFLDIQMPEMDGFQVLEQIKTKVSDQTPVIVFVTAFDQYALKAFQFHAVDYLLKPFDRNRFAESFRIAKDRVQHPQTDYKQQIVDLLERMKTGSENLEWVSVRKNERITLLKIDDVFWVEAYGNYVQLRINDQSHVLREKMDSLEEKLDPQTFIRIHRSAIVNVNFIKEIQVWNRGEYKIVMQTGKTFAVTRTFRNRFDNFMKKKVL